MSGSSFRLLIISFGRPSICPVCKRHFESYWEAAEHLHEIHETGFQTASYKYLPFALWHTAQKVLRARERVRDLETAVETLEKKQLQQQQQIEQLQKLLQPAEQKHECRHCKESFPSRTQLFKHLPTCSAVSKKGEKRTQDPAPSDTLEQVNKVAEAMATLQLAGYTVTK
ncbi:hypothetical protein GGR56DRAFT_120173 [Xylariaceae sp. FL0804]|nr:hypothetical protein GGR56DRAFT_120173 [Xylariaceae sp. FL0804]